MSTKRVGYVQGIGSKSGSPYLLIGGIFLFALGLVMVFNTSSAEILDRSLGKNTHYALIRQILYAVVGVTLALVVYRLGYLPIIRLSPYLLLVTTICLVLVFIPGIGCRRNGASRWIMLGTFGFQPSELAKFLIPMTFIEWVVTRTGEISLKSFSKILLILAVPLFLILIEPDNGTVAVICLTMIPLFFVARMPTKYWGIPVLAATVAAIAAAATLPYVRGRVQVYLHPESDLLGRGHQAYQAKIAAGSGGLVGKGAGMSLQKLTYLPEAQNDYIAAIFAEEFGYIGMLFIILLYMLLALGGTRIMLLAERDEGAYLALVVTFLITLQAFLNLGVVSGLLPSKGVNLPLFSQGGTSLVANVMGLSLLMTVERQHV